jgi:hypothetical protein
VRFRLWSEPPAATAGMQIYRVGHMSISAAGA